MAERSEATTGKELMITRMFNAPREMVFKVWTDPAYITRWWGPHGFTLPSCKMEFRRDGAYRFCMRSPDGGDYWVEGEYREIVEPQKIVFSWRREFEDSGVGPESLVTVTFEDVGARTKLTLHHTGFKDAETRDDHNGGWTECMDRLVEFVERMESRG